MYARIRVGLGNIPTFMYIPISGIKNVKKNLRVCFGPKEEKKNTEILFFYYLYCHSFTLHHKTIPLSIIFWVFTLLI